MSVGFGSDVRTTYTLNGSNISKKVEGGRVELLNGSYTLVYGSPSTSTVTGDTTTWNPISGSRYVWVEGQAKAEETRYKYEKNSFTWSTIDSWNDGVAADGSYKWKETRLLDATPLLESESVVTPGDGDYHSSWSNGVVNATYEEKVDLGARIDPNDRVRLVPNSSIASKVAQYMGETAPTKATGTLHTVYRFLGSSQETILLYKEDFTDTARWAVDTSSFGSINNTTRFESNYLRYDYDLQQWTTGGGYMKKKTAHSLVTETLGKKDYYTYAMKADYAIDVEFEGNSTQSININTDGDVVLEGNLRMGASTADLVINAGGTIRSIGAAGALGASSVDIDGQGEIDLLIQGASVTFDVRTTTGDVALNIVSEGGSSANLNYTQISTDDGNVSIVAGDNITAANNSATISGDIVRLTAQSGSIGTGDRDVRVNTGSEGGLVALAESSIYLTETEGDMRLIDPAGVGTTASIASNSGSVSLTASTGSILDAWGEEVASLTDDEAQTKAEELGIDSGIATLNLINGQLDSEEQRKTRAYHRC